MVRACAQANASQAARQEDRASQRAARWKKKAQSLEETLAEKHTHLGGDDSAEEYRLHFSFIR